MDKKKTIFCDIDGTIIEYRQFTDYLTGTAAPIWNTISYLNRERKKGSMIILTTARPQELYNHTIKELQECSVPFDRLVMGIERGTRVLINDMEQNSNEPRAIAINLIRNKGIQ